MCVLGNDAYRLSTDGTNISGWHWLNLVTTSPAKVTGNYDLCVENHLKIVFISGRWIIVIQRDDSKKTWMPRLYVCIYIYMYTAYTSIQYIYILYACIIYIYADTDTHVTFMHLPKPLNHVKHTLYDSPAMHNRGLLVTRDDEVTPHFLKGIWYFDIYICLYCWIVCFGALFWGCLKIGKLKIAENHWKSLSTPSFIMPFARKKAINDINQDIQCVIYRNAKFMLSQPTSTVSRYSTCSKISWSGNLMVRSNRQANLIFTPGAKRLCTCLKRPLVKKRE